MPQLCAIVVDGGSGDGSGEVLEGALSKPDFAGWTSFLGLSLNGGFGWANNNAICKLLQAIEPPEFIHLLNPDCEVEVGAVQALAAYLRENPRVGAVGSQLLDSDGTVTGSAFNFPSVRGELARGARTGALDKFLGVRQGSLFPATATEVDWVTGASVMFRVAALREAGLFDEGFFLYHEETELMWRLRRAGWKIAVEPRSRVRHLGGASTGVNNRPSESGVQPRKPVYWYRSRARLFALTRGRVAAALAYVAWFAGYTFWTLRRLFGLARGAKPFSHQLRDHLRYAFPRSHDHIPAARPVTEGPTSLPTWMERQAL